MRRILLVGALTGASLFAAACEPTQVGPGAETNRTREAAAERAREQASLPKVVLPPSIRASKSYRCSDNSLLMAEWYSDDRSAAIRTDAKESATRVTGAAPGEAMTAEGGWSLKGGYKDAKVTFSSPKHPKPMTCHV
jgi:hypothetical protein